MPRVYPVLLVVPRCVPSKLQNLREGLDSLDLQIKSQFETLISFPKNAHPQNRQRSKIMYLGGEVLEDGGEVDGSTGAVPDRVTTFLQVTRDTTDGKLKTSLDGLGNTLLPITSFPSSCASRRLRCCCWWRLHRILLNKLNKHKLLFPIWRFCSGLRFAWYDDLMIQQRVSIYTIYCHAGDPCVDEVNRSDCISLSLIQRSTCLDTKRGGAG